MKFYGCLPAALIWASHVLGATPPRVLYRVETVAGSARIGDGGQAIAAQVSNILGVAADQFGNIYVSDTDNHRLRKISRAGVIATFAGTGVAGFRGDGAPAVTAQLNYPAGLAIDRSGFLYIADSGNNRVRKIFDSGVIATVLGGSSSTALSTPLAIAVDLAGTVYIGDSSF